VDRRMKKIIFLAVLIGVWCAGFLPAGTASAQDALSPDAVAAATAEGVQSTRPPATSPATIAMIFYKLTARAPDFESWVKQKDFYKNASPFEQPNIMTEQVQKMKDSYNLIMLTEPIVVETQVKLAPYDETNQGFFVESFKSSTFFPVTYAGESYAIVPQGITDKQWLKMDDPTIAKSIDAAAGNDRLLTMVLRLTPRFADAKSPAAIDGENYWPIAADIKSMMIYPLNKDTLLWQSDNADTKDKNHQGILNLYQ
jgi:hypothetical protein